MSNVYEIIARQKLRFESARGQLTVEDLWDLPLTSTVNKTNLDDIARGLHKQLKNGDDVSFVMKDKKSDPTTQLKFDVVKSIIDTRLAENEAAAKTRSDAEKKQKLLAILADREDNDLKTKSTEELRKLVNEL